MIFLNHLNITRGHPRFNPSCIHSFQHPKIPIIPPAFSPAIPHSPILDSILYTPPIHQNRMIHRVKWCIKPLFNILNHILLQRNIYPRLKPIKILKNSNIHSNRPFLINLLHHLKLSLSDILTCNPSHSVIPTNSDLRILTLHNLLLIPFLLTVIFIKNHIFIICTSKIILNKTVM
jgi:hypothetical protein